VSNKSEYGLKCPRCNEVSKKLHEEYNHDPNDGYEGSVVSGVSFSVSKYLCEIGHTFLVENKYVQT
jgi:hypothetical protein